MTLEERIDRLERAIKIEQEQCVWLLSEDWEDNRGSVEVAVAQHERVINTYESLVQKLK